MGGGYIVHCTCAHLASIIPYHISRQAGSKKTSAKKKKQQRQKKQQDQIVTTAAAAASPARMPATAGKNGGAPSAKLLDPRAVSCGAGVHVVMLSYSYLLLLERLLDPRPFSCDSGLHVVMHSYLYLLLLERLLDPHAVSHGGRSACSHAFVSVLVDH